MSWHAWLWAYVEDVTAIAILLLGVVVVVRRRLVPWWEVDDLRDRLAMQQGALENTSAELRRYVRGAELVDQREGYMGTRPTVEVGLLPPPPQSKASAGSRYGGQERRKGVCAYCGTYAGDLRSCGSCGAPNPWYVGPVPPPEIVAREEAREYVELRPRVGIRLPEAEPECVTRMIPTDVSWR